MKRLAVIIAKYCGWLTWVDPRIVDAYCQHTRHSGNPPQVSPKRAARKHTGP